MPHGWKAKNFRSLFGHQIWKPGPAFETNAMFRNAVHCYIHFFRPTGHQCIFGLAVQLVKATEALRSVEASSFIGCHPISPFIFRKYHKIVLPNSPLAKSPARICRPDNATSNNAIVDLLPCPAQYVKSPTALRSPWPRQASTQLKNTSQLTHPTYSRSIAR